MNDNKEDLNNDTANLNDNKADLNDDNIDVNQEIGDNKRSVIGGIFKWLMIILVIGFFLPRLCSDSDEEALAEVQLAKPYFGDWRPGSDFVRITFLIKNNSSSTIDGIVLHGLLRDPNDVLPKHLGFIYAELGGRLEPELGEGLKPGEAKKVIMNAGPDKHWYQVYNVPNNAIFKLEPVGIIRSDGSRIGRTEVVETYHLDVLME